MRYCETREEQCSKEADVDAWAAVFDWEDGRWMALVKPVCWSHEEEWRHHTNALAFVDRRTGLIL